MPSRRKAVPTGRRPVVRWHVTPRSARRPLPARRRLPPSRSRRRRLWLLAAVIALIASSGAYLFLSARGGVALSALSSWGTIERTIKSRALVWRQETVVPAPVGGVLRLAVREGERVRTGQTLAELVDLEDRRDLEARLADVERRLAAADAGGRADRERLENQLASATASYHEALGQLARGALERRLDAFAHAWPALTAAGAARSAAQGGLGQLDRDREELLSLRQELLAGMEAAGHEVAAPVQGLVSLVLDGLEGIGRDQLAAMSTWDLLSLRENRVELASGGRLSARQPVCKVIDPQGLVLAMVLSTGAAAGLEMGGSITVRFPQLGQAILRGQVTGLGPAERTGSRVVRISTDGVLAGLSSLRWTACELLLLSRSGVIVPSGSLTSRDGQQGVLVLSRSSAYFRPVTILAADGRSVLVEGIASGTAVALHPWLWGLLGRLRGLPG
ncbi:MAG: HlyD family efflux transporter periplasmic adaptor subunit [Bacillota bacterium]|nr:HlyD family efflux transporter periplasmic adaptor subunit [Bacillota bacterium]